MHILHFNYFILHSHLHFGMLSERHNLPHPTLSFGYRSNPGRGWAPRRRYAFTFSPQRKGSFPLTIPHSIKRAADPVTNGVAIDVPDLTLSPPPTAAAGRRFAHSSAQALLPAPGGRLPSSCPAAPDTSVPLFPLPPWPSPSRVLRGFLRA